MGGWRVSGITPFYTGVPIDFGGYIRLRKNDRREAFFRSLYQPIRGVSAFSIGMGLAVQGNTTGPVKVSKGVCNDPQFGPRVTWLDPIVIAQLLAPQLDVNGEPGMFRLHGTGYAHRAGSKQVGPRITQRVHAGLVRS